MLTRWLAAAAILLIPALLTAETAPLTDAQIEQWWKSGQKVAPDERLEVNGNMTSIKLTGNEEAVLVTVTFPGRGRNSYDGVLLVRPKLKEAREIEGIKNFKVFTSFRLDSEPSLISAAGSDSGGGTTFGEKRALFFDGWNPVVLHEERLGNNSGSCGPDRACFAQELEWIFLDLNGDSRVDLVEVVIQKYGGQNKTRWVAKTNTYLRKGNRFVASPSSMQMDPKLLK